MEGLSLRFTSLPPQRALSATEFSSSVRCRTRPKLPLHEPLQKRKGKHSRRDGTLKDRSPSHAVLPFPFSVISSSSVLPTSQPGPPSRCASQSKCPWLGSVTGGFDSPREPGCFLSASLSLPLPRCASFLRRVLGARCAPPSVPLSSSPLQAFPSAAASSPTSRAPPFSRPPPAPSSPCQPYGSMSASRSYREPSSSLSSCHLLDCAFSTWSSRREVSSCRVFMTCSRSPGLSPGSLPLRSPTPLNFYHTSSRNRQACQAPLSCVGGHRGPTTPHAPASYLRTRRVSCVVQAAWYPERERFCRSNDRVPERYFAPSRGRYLESTFHKAAGSKVTLHASSCSRFCASLASSSSCSSPSRAFSSLAGGSGHSESSACSSEGRPFFSRLSSSASTLSTAFLRFVRWVTGAGLLLLPVGLWCSVFTPVVLVCPDAPLPVALSFVASDSQGEEEAETTGCCPLPQAEGSRGARVEATSSSRENALGSSNNASSAPVRGRDPGGKSKEGRQLATAYKNSGEHEQPEGHGDAAQGASAEGNVGAGTEDARELDGHQRSVLEQGGYVPPTADDKAQRPTGSDGARSGVVCVGTPFLLREGLWRNTVVYVQHPMRSPRKVFLRLVAGEGNVIRFPVRALLSIHPTLRKEVLVSGRGRVVGSQGETESFFASFVLSELLRQCDEEIAAEIIHRENARQSAQSRRHYASPQGEAAAEFSEKKPSTSRRKPDLIEEHEGARTWIMTPGEPLLLALADEEVGGGAEATDILGSRATRKHSSRSIPISTPGDQEGASCVSSTSGTRLALERGSQAGGGGLTSVDAGETKLAASNGPAGEENLHSPGEVDEGLLSSFSESSRGFAGGRAPAGKAGRQLEPSGFRQGVEQPTTPRNLEEVICIELTVPKGKCWLEADGDTSRKRTMRRDDTLSPSSGNDSEGGLHREPAKAYMKSENGRSLVDHVEGVWWPGRLQWAEEEEEEDSFTFGFVPAGLIAGAAFWLLPAEFSVRSAKLMVFRACLASIMTELADSVRKSAERTRRSVRHFFSLKWRSGGHAEKADVNARDTEGPCEQRPSGGDSEPGRGGGATQPERGQDNADNIRRVDLKRSLWNSQEESDQRKSNDPPGTEPPSSQQHSQGDEGPVLNEAQLEGASFGERVFFRIEQWLLKHADLRVIAADDSRLVSAKGTVVVE